MKINPFETDRCLIREINYGDASRIVKWRSDPEVYKFFKNPVQIDVNGHLRWYCDSYLNNQNRIDLIIEEKDGNVAIGVFGISRIDDHSAEVSYLLEESHQGKGYASEALAGIELHFGDLWHIDRFVAEIHKENAKSISFIQRCGYGKTSAKGDFYIFSKTR